MANSSFFKNLVSSRFRKAIIVAISIIVILIVGAYAYRVSFPPQVGPEVTVTSPPLQFSMQIDKTEYNLGENVSITFRLKNTSNETLTIEYKNPTEPVIPEKLFNFVIQNASNQDMYQGILNGYGNLTSGTFFTLGPNEEKIETNFWNQMASVLDHPGGSYILVPVTVGTYNIIGIMPSLDAFRVNGGSWIILETPSITFTVR